MVAVLVTGCLLWGFRERKPLVHVDEEECALCNRITKTCSETLREWFQTERFRDYTLHALEGKRTRAEQEAHFAAGRSKATFGKSPHNYKPSRALDVHYIVDGVPDWKEGRYKTLATRMPSNIEWGGDWKGFKDSFHFQEVHWTNLIENYPNGN